MYPFAHRPGGIVSVQDIDIRLKPVGEAIIKQFSLGTLTAFGREYRGFKQLNAAPIPASFWRTASFTYWFLDADPSSTGVLHAKNDEGIQFTDIEVKRADALKAWPTALNEEVSLFDAASRAYGETRGTDVAETAERDYDHPIKWYVAYFMSVSKTPMFGNMRFSPKRELIDPRGFDPIVAGDQIILEERYEQNGKRRKWENITIKRPDLDDAIKRLIKWGGKV